MQKYKILRIKSHQIDMIKFSKMVDMYSKQFVKIAHTVSGESYLYFKKSVSDKRLVKIHNLIIK